MTPRVLVAASVKPIILSVLRDGATYGYAIVQRIHELSNGDIQWSDGTLYPVLHKLETEGLVVSIWQKSDVGRRRKYYELTAAGEAALDIERRQWLEVDAVLAQLWGLQPRIA
jgi:PadR family transcriptional regulator PadR